MRGPGDHFDEMSTDTLSDEAIEAFFSGLAHPGWQREKTLRALAQDAALAVSGPPPPASHALLQLFWARKADAPPAAGSLGKRLRLGTGALVASFFALVGVGAAGAVGILPATAQGVVARVVEAVTPFELPYPAGDPADPAADAPNDEGGQPATQLPGSSPMPGTGPASPHQPWAGAGAAPSPAPPGPASGLEGGTQGPAGDGSGWQPAPGGASSTAGPGRSGQTPPAPHARVSSGPPADPRRGPP